MGIAYLAGKRKPISKIPADKIGKKARKAKEVISIIYLIYLLL
jgi:hypothetical protein